VNVSVLVQDTNTGFQHDRDLAKLNLREFYLFRFFVFQLVPRPDQILNVQVNREIGGIREVTKPRVVGKHQLGGPIVFMDLWTINTQIFKLDKHFQPVILTFFDVIMWGLDVKWIEHLDGAFHLILNEIIVRLDLVFDQLLEMLVREVRLNDFPAILLFIGFIASGLHFTH
jgi:hypothetical protein